MFKFAVVPSSCLVLIQGPMRTKTHATWRLGPTFDVRCRSFAPSGFVLVGWQYFATVNGVPSLAPLSNGGGRSDPVMGVCMKSLQPTTKIPYTTHRTNACIPHMHPTQTTGPTAAKQLQHRGLILPAPPSIPPNGRHHRHHLDQPPASPRGHGPHIRPGAFWSKASDALHMDTFSGDGHGNNQARRRGGSCRPWPHAPRTSEPWYVNE